MCSATFEAMSSRLLCVDVVENRLLLRHQLAAAGRGKWPSHLPVVRER